MDYKIDLVIGGNNICWNNTYREDSMYCVHLFDKFASMLVTVGYSRDVVLEGLKECLNDFK